ncbi:MAG TPA: SMC-Scp complex subunit ScpB [Terracidiphilus sp.]|nr:SMC-Scp complex subunit ScpB [Terracidiphilus sp.]
MNKVLIVAMSLKAKLEAVIYAAEEPVTLTQLASLFAADALEWKAEQEAAAREAAAETAEAEPLPMLVEGMEYLELETAEAAPAPEDPAPAADEAVPAESAAPESPAPEPAASAEEAPAPDATAETEPAAPVDEESEAKRLARQRDREVRAILRQILDEIVAEYAADARGVEIREIAGGYRMATKPECHDAVRLFIKSQKPPLKLSLPALETLAVIAYKQPVTAPEVSEIRGVESGGVLGSLLSRKLIATAGRKQVIGRPILYKTTKEFLLRFGLKDISELPSMEEFEKMAASELSDTGAEDTAAEEAAQAAVGAPPEGQPDLDEDAPEDGEPTGIEPIEEAVEPTQQDSVEEASEPEASSPEAAPEAQASVEPETGDAVAEEPAPAEPAIAEPQAETETPHGN